ncbi:MAG: PadR family transcriptional regulator [Geodermatophilaceae bacterium]|jgi:DNA-binding PadR family transcriptional regulator|nr:PadR family transcriptional regulator [Geodermatophilaceae bacterium]
MSAGHVLLGLLANGQRHGYDLKRQYQRRFPSAKPLAAAQIYATLERLLRDGLVAAGATERAGGPDRTLFAVTRRGRAELDRWLSEVELPSEYVANLLAVKVTLALLIADQAVAADFLRCQREAHLTRMREQTRVKADPHADLLRVVAADYAINHLDADLRWIDSTLQRVGQLAKEIRP